MLVACLSSVHVRDNTPRYELAVLVPILPVLFAAREVVAPLTVDQQARKVQAVEVRDDGCRALTTARKAPRQAHDPVAQVVDVPRHAPPSTRDELSGKEGMGEGVGEARWQIVVTNPHIQLILIMAISKREGRGESWHKLLAS